ncbi:carbohydrate-binding module family 1 protein [Durotheca rogersii]|uniref:carbohydrate-binding module family 1 protein n=1 Tax=Durotheca rogersii TaxID=419775 RepID=UPI00221E811A|nr:carbohydrate-binding module family 1 protein [Durotheca rogersii]KAI5858265.1 carbohydrate-binding module family 1 protein [Durotheca rogersii]
MAGGWGLSLAAAVVAIAWAVRAQNYPLVADSRCNCYRTNATAPEYFAQHRFFDFRELGAYAGAGAPAAIEDPAASAAAPVTSRYFEEAAWTSAWAIQRWNNSARTDGDATALMVNSPSNVFLARNDDPRPASQTYLVLRTARHAAFQSAAEIESRSLGYRFLSVRMHARTRGAPGAVTAMFTFRGAAALAQVQEADLEVRTADPPRAVQYTNQPSWDSAGDIAAATRNVTLPHPGGWSAWQTHRLDWTPGASSWFADGRLVAQIRFQAPRDPSHVIFNAWSDGGSWSGNMSRGAAAEMHIQWIDLVYNTTDPAAGNPRTDPAAPACANTCSIDLTSKLGTPVLISGPNASPNPGDSPGACTSAKYGQCAGKTWNGCTSCASGTTCRFQNDYYSQCL